MNKNKVTKLPEINEYRNAFDTGLTKPGFKPFFINYVPIRHRSIS